MARMSALTILIHYNVDKLASAVSSKARKRNKKLEDHKGRNCFLFADNMIVFVENPKESTKKKKKDLEPISEFSKVAGYKLNIQKLFVFLYVSDEYMDNKIENTVLFIIAQKIPTCKSNKTCTGLMSCKSIHLFNHGSRVIEHP